MLVAPAFLGLVLAPTRLSLATVRVAPCAMSAVDVADVYSRLDQLVRRARTRSVGGLAERAANSITGQWLSTPPSRLAEAVLVSGRLLLDSFDEGLELLMLAEAQEEANLSGAAYSSLMRLGMVERRYSDVLGLLARARSRGGGDSPGALLSAMQAADALGDWGAVARLFSMMSAMSDSEQETAEAQEQVEEEGEV